MNKSEIQPVSKNASPSKETAKEMKMEMKPGKGRKSAAEKPIEQPLTPEKNSKVLKAEKNEETKQTTLQRLTPKNVKSAGKIK